MRKLCVLLITAGALFPSVSIAERRQRPGARELIEASALIREGRCDAAIPLLRRAHEIGDLRNALWNLGECYRLLGRPRLAIDAYRQYIAHRRTSAQDRAEAERVIERLETSIGRIVISGNVEGALVQVDAMDEGVTPTTVEVGPGPHIVEVQSPGFAPYRVEVETAAGEEVAVEAELQLLPGELAVTSSPEGAEVWVDGVLRGETPWSDDTISSGGHSVELRLDRYRTVNRQVLLRPGQRSAVEFRLEPVAGTLAVATNAPGATLLVDGEERGRAPFTPLTLSPGSHHLEVRAEDYQDWSDDVDVVDGRTTRVELELSSTRGLHQGWFWGVAGVAILAFVGALSAFAVDNYFLNTVYEPLATAVERDQTNPLGLASARADGTDALEAHIFSRNLAIGLGLTVVAAALADFFIGLYTRWRSPEVQSEVSIEGEAGEPAAESGAVEGARP